MEQYKPGYLGQALPVGNPNKMTDFVANKYDAFSKVYDACKSNSEKIKEISLVESNNSDSLSIKVSTDQETMNTIKESNKDDSSLDIHENVITVNQ